MAEYEGKMDPGGLKLAYYGRGIAYSLPPRKARFHWGYEGFPDSEGDPTTRWLREKVYAEVMRGCRFLDGVLEGEGLRREAWERAHPWRARARRVGWWWRNRTYRFRLAWRVLWTGDCGCE